VSSPYLEHFGLSRNPFSATPDPRFLFLTPKHREALAALLFAVTERKGFLVLTGEAGTGKTTLIRKLLLSIPVACAQFSVIVNPVLTRSELLESVLLDFGEKQIPASKPQRLELFRRRLLAAEAEGRTSVVVIDEAHLLTEELMEEVRLLSNFETAEHKLVQIVLAGQSELDRVLSLESLRQVRQRVAIRMQIDPLDESEVRLYLQSRWSRASERPLAFSEDAITLMARASRGIPRLLNMMADAALVNAFASGVHLITKTGIEEVLRDLGLAPALISVRAAALAAPDISVLSAPYPSRSAIPTAAPVIDRYAPVKQDSPRRWRIASWLGLASGGEK
jgi:general secretion pathway protein A